MNNINKAGFYALMVLTVIVLCHCKKESQNGTALITVAKNGQALSNATVYMKKGVTDDPGIPVSRYDENVQVSSDGVAIFKGLSPDNYYFFAIATVASNTIAGSVVVKVKGQAPQSSYDTGPRYEKTIHVQ